MGALDGVGDFLTDNHRAVLLTYRRDGSPHLSPIVAAVDDDDRVMFSTVRSRTKVRNLRADNRASICVMSDHFYGDWLQIDGTAEIVPLPAALDGLVESYRRIAGEHPDWDAYREAMTREDRVLVRIAPVRIGPGGRSTRTG